MRASSGICSDGAFASRGRLLEVGACDATAPVTVSSTSSSGGRIFASPLAKKLSKEKGYDLSAITGSGPNGRIVAEDVNSFTPSTVPTSPSATSTTTTIATPTATSTPVAIPSAETTSISTAFSTDVSVSPAQKLMGEVWTESKRTVPHYYLTVDLNLTAAQALQSRDESITTTGILAKAMAKVAKGESEAKDGGARYEDV